MGFFFFFFFWAGGGVDEVPDRISYSFRLQDRKSNGIFFFWGAG